MTKYRHYIGILLTTTIGANLSHSSTDMHFNKDNLRKDIQILASDSFEGRRPLTPGEEKTVEYLNKRFKELQLSPLPGKDSYELPVPLVTIKTEVPGPIHFGDYKPELGQDIAIRSSEPQDTVHVKDAEVVFIGYGINSKQWEWNDYQDLDVKGKIVVTLVNDPGFVSPKKFRGKDLTYFGRWTYKLEEAQRQGALGAFVIHETAAAGYGWNIVGNMDTNIELAQSAQKDSKPPLKIHGWLTETAARKMFKDSGYDYEFLKKQSEEHPGTRAFLKKSHLTVSISNNVSKGLSKNLCGMKKGTHFQTSL